MSLVDFIETESVEGLSSVSHRAAYDFGNELLGMAWPDERRVAELAGVTSEKDSTQYAACLRNSGALLGVWDAQQGRFRHPDFQLDPFGNVRPEVAELLSILPGADTDNSGWRRAFWLYSPHPLLRGEIPAEAFIDDARRVIEVAGHEFRADRDAQW